MIIYEMRKRIGIAVICIPFAIIFIYIAFELIGITVNHYATSQQTKSLKKTILSVAPESEILDTYSETGNTSGTGNHVDMLSVILVKTDAEFSVLENSFNGYYLSDDCAFWIEETDSVKSRYDECSLPSFYEFLSVPKETQSTYIVYLCQPAPFADNMEGH